MDHHRERVQVRSTRVCGRVVLTRGDRRCISAYSVSGHLRAVALGLTLPMHDIPRYSPSVILPSVQVSD